MEYPADFRGMRNPWTTSMKWLAVVLATLNPLTGRAIAIPLGVSLGLPVLGVCLVSGVSNFLLASTIVLFLERIEHLPAVSRFIEKKRGKRLTKFIEGKGLLYAVILGPFVLGTFTITLVFQSLGADKKRMLLYCLLSALIVTPIVAWISLDYKNLLQAALQGTI